MGDLTVTYNRSRAVEFSFLTLADNEAFLTHKPGRLNEALALVHSFHWDVSGRLCSLRIIVVSWMESDSLCLPLLC